MEYIFAGLLVIVFLAVVFCILWLVCSVCDSIQHWEFTMVMTNKRYAKIKRFILHDVIPRVVMITVLATLALLLVLVYQTILSFIT